MTKPKIFNLSDKVLSQQRANILHRGLISTPSPISNKIELNNDVQQFSRKLCLLEFSYTENEIAAKCSDFPCKILSRVQNYWMPEQEGIHKLSLIPMVQWLFTTILLIFTVDEVCNITNKNRSPSNLAKCQSFYILPSFQK